MCSLKTRTSSVNRSTKNWGRNYVLYRVWRRKVESTKIDEYWKCLECEHGKEWMKKKITWIQKMPHKEVLKRVRDRQTILETIKIKKENCLGHRLHKYYTVRDITEGMVEWMRGRERRRIQPPDNIKGNKSYNEIKRKAQDLDERNLTWRKCCFRQHTNDDDDDDVNRDNRACYDCHHLLSDLITRQGFPPR